jgi:hypothetical protein
MQAKELFKLLVREQLVRCCGLRGCVAPGSRGGWSTPSGNAALI